jgi:hypothetical protein
MEECSACCARVLLQTGARDSGVLGVIAGETAILAAAWFTRISFLWYNVIGCVVVVAVGLLLSAARGRRFLNLT